MSDDLAERIEKAAVVLKAAGAREVYLFGSATKGPAAAPSDVDIAVSGLPPEAFFRAMSEARDALGRPMHLIDLDEATPFTRYLKQAGELRRVG